MGVSCWFHRAVFRLSRVLDKLNIVDVLCICSGKEEGFSQGNVAEEVVV